MHKLSGSDRPEKLKQLEIVLGSQQQFFTRACDSNKNTTKASYEVAMLIAKQGKPFTLQKNDRRDCWLLGIFT